MNYGDAIYVNNTLVNKSKVSIYKVFNKFIDSILYKMFLIFLDFPFHKKQIKKIIK